tara:strand:- start:15332 stop:16018 length:687 start_codon:yes stop_codon:yes gene_type:complete
MSDIIKLNSWKEVTEYIDNGFWQPTPSYFEHIVQHNSYYPNHAFSKGQLASKSWLLEKLHKINWRHQPKSDIVVILGSWIGAMVEPLHKTFEIGRIYGIDTDAIAIEKSEKLNQKFVQDKWKYKGVVHDVDLLECDNMQFETSGELINCKPDWVINTSCEHMSTLWYDTVDNDQLIIMQTNNSLEFDGHINPCYTLDEMQEKYPLSKTLFVGALETPAYTRFMQIGYK